MLSTYLITIGMYLLAIGYNRQLAWRASGSAGWLADLTAMLGFGFTALLLTGGLFPGNLHCPVGNLNGNLATYGQCVGVVGGLLSALVFRK